MTYQSLYRRFRPRRFSEIRGQPHVSEALRNAVRTGRISHAYLFSGPRGTGKTSTARILAKALNCQNPEDGEPCCACESCLAVEQGRSFDIHELDAASHNRVDDMRELVERASLGTPGRTKVYILDEVHMLSAAASNALLKTLEEPPEHVVFVLATTDPQKVLPTIRSRTQHFEFHLLGSSELKALVEDVISQADLDVTPEAVEYALRKGGGSARDTLSALEQVVNIGMAAPTERAAEELLVKIRDADVAGALKTVEDAVSGGREPRSLAEEMVERLRELFLLQMGADVGHLADTTRSLLEDLAGSMGPRAVTRALELFGEATVEMRNAIDPRVPLELAVLRAARPELDKDLEALAQRVERLERMVAGGRAPTLPPASSQQKESDADPSSSPSQGGSSSPLERVRKVLRETEERASSTRPTRRAENPRPRDEPGVEAKTTRSSPPRTESSGPMAEESPRGFATATKTAPSRDEVTLVWADEILPHLSQAARARFKVGRFLPSDNGSVIFAVPTEAFLPRCRELSGEVERALRERFGTDVHLEVKVDDDSRASREFEWTGLLDSCGDEAVRTPDRDASSEATGTPGADLVSLEDLEDASLEATLRRVQKYFPGARVVTGEEGRGAERS